jgi:hypothetical protein
MFVHPHYKRWSFWIYFPGSVEEASKFKCEIRLFNRGVTRELSYTGPAISMDKAIDKIIQVSILKKRFLVTCILQKLTVRKIYGHKVSIFTAVNADILIV